MAAPIGTPIVKVCLPMSRISILFGSYVSRINAIIGSSIIKSTGYGKVHLAAGWVARRGLTAVHVAGRAARAACGSTAERAK